MTQISEPYQLVLENVLSYLRGTFFITIVETRNFKVSMSSDKELRLDSGVGVNSKIFPLAHLRKGKKVT